MRNSRPSSRPHETIEQAGLYVHVPFCRTKCLYCDFYSTTDNSLIDRWLRAVEGEMAFYEGAFGVFDSLYVGGGTPSLLGVDQLTTLVAALNRHFSFSKNIEFTVEANPDDISIEKLLAMRDLGVNRLSLGVQSFNEKELSFLKRRHNAAGAERAIEACRKAGFLNVGFDLIYALPGQTKAEWLATLERAISFQPTHLSCYQLTAEGEAPLSTMIESGVLQLPDDKKASQLFLLTSKFLRSRGFTHYEVSNFAQTAQERCRHNQKYWRHIPYLGLGPAAHSFDGVRRWWNNRSVNDYCTAIEHGKYPMEDMESLTREQVALERIYLGLRTETGISTEDLPERSEAAVKQLRRSGIVRLEAGRIKPTMRGYLVADSLPLLLTRP